MRMEMWIVAAATSLAMLGCGSKGTKPVKVAQADKAPAKAAPKPEPARDEAKFKLGEQVFKKKSSPACKSCHVLEAAGSRGAIGPNLDTLVKTEAEIIKAVTGGLGVMPAQNEILSTEEIQAVAYYVIQARKG